MGLSFPRSRVGMQPVTLHVTEYGRRIKPSLVSAFLAAIYLIIGGTAVKATETPLIAAASSTQFALEEISREFTANTGLRIKISYGSSGNFTRQIAQAAPFEMFISADETYVEKLEKLGLTLDHGSVYATGRVVLFVPLNSSIKVDKGLVDLKAALKDGRLKRFAIANPQHAPFGRAAKEVLISGGLWNDIQSKLILGENVAQAAQFASSGTTQGGLFSYSFALVPAVKSLGHFVLLPASLHQSFHARMVLLKQAGATTTAFYQFLQSTRARSIFDRSGFLLPQQ